MTFSPLLLAHISALLDEQITRHERASGSSAFHQTGVLRSDTGSYFIKANTLDYAPVMDAEFDALRELQAESIKAPEPIVNGVFNDQSFLVMEHLSLHAMSSKAQKQLGRALAVMHTACKPYFGWHRDNTIGVTPQYNAQHQDWVEFYCTQRLQPMQAFLKSHKRAQALIDDVERLLPLVEKLFAGQDVQPVLLHGDFWAGNAAMLADHTPVIFDAAMFYGDRESDIAMSELFGGFSADFYAAYREVHADSRHGARQRELYRLYHLLNHCVLFGGSYYAQAKQSVQRLLSVLVSE